MSQFRKILPVLSVLLLLFSPAEAALKIGDKAPDFTVSTTRGKAALGDFLARGPLVLAFYFADFTPT